MTFFNVAARGKQAQALATIAIMLREEANLAPIIACASCKFRKVMARADKADNEAATRRSAAANARREADELLRRAQEAESAREVALAAMEAGVRQFGCALPHNAFLQV